MTSVVENSGLSLARYEYDDLGRRKRRVLGNGTSTAYDYDPASRLSALTLNGGGQANSTSFAWNPAGQIASRTISNDAYAFTGHYTIDRGYAVNGLNQYAASGDVVPTYDARGDLTSAAGGSWLYNSKNQLSGAVRRRHPPSAGQPHAGLSPLALAPGRDVHEAETARWFTCGGHSVTRVRCWRAMLPRGGPARCPGARRRR
ncbi:RHS repeat protein [Sphingomonas sp. RP10(2022)]|uniref:RHS repeat protein n=1 Tax=Sphingomonas liriopis TaxID=2949094 RepID=A0A9X2KPE3_9SPHN|nr:RHS repeat domain-containing protein [Sphingomonas liriopis]MCP3734634.1 RHS repeat protein [Sphingomonas liriopis]